MLDLYIKKHFMCIFNSSNTVCIWKSIVFKKKFDFPVSAQCHKKTKNKADKNNKTYFLNHNNIQNSTKNITFFIYSQKNVTLQAWCEFTSFFTKIILNNTHHFMKRSFDNMFTWYQKCFLKSHFLWRWIFCRNHIHEMNNGIKKQLTGNKRFV